jgi:hypothetical protein
LKEQFNLFKLKYDEQKEYYKNNPNESSIFYIATMCRDLGTQLKNEFYQSKNPRKGDKVQLLSGIFALWAILKSEKDDT